MALNTQIKVGADSSGVATGLEPGKRALKDFGASADGAGKSLAGMGNGSAQSAQKVEQATKSMIQSIQRTTAATEAGDKSTRAYQESLARMRGIDVAALKPYLDQLDAAKSKAAQAATANNSLGDSFAGLSSRSVIAAGAIGAIGAALSAAFSAASIKGVIDVADTFSKLSQKSGVAVEALRELNYAASLSDVSTEALGTGLRKLSQNMASAAGGGKEQAAAFAAIGVSVKGMDGALKGADVVLSEIAGKFANFSDGPEKAALAIELFGKQGADMIPLLNSGTSGLSEMAKEAAELGIVFGSDLAKNAEAFNDNLTRIQTSSEGAKIAIANELLPTLNYLAQAFLDAQKAGSGFGSFIGGALKTIIEAATILYSDVEFVLKGVGREFGAIGAQVVALGKLDIKGFTAISAAVKEDGVRARAELDKFQYDLLNAGILSSKAGAGRGTANDPRLLGSTQTTAPIIAATAAAKELREVVNKAAKEDIAAFRLMADLKTKFQGEEMARIEKTREELEKTMEAYAKAAEAGVSNAIAAATAAEAELSNYGLLKSEVQALGLVQLEQARESAAMAGEDVANIEKRIAAQKRLIAATKGVELRTSSDNAAKEAAAEWKRTADSINSTLTDALMRGFESGKDFARNLRDTVVNMFKTLVLRPIISAVMNPIAGAITGGLGLSGAAQAASTGGSLLNTVGMASSLAGLGSTIAGTIGTAIGSVTGGLVAANAATVTLLTGSASSAAAAASAAAVAGGTAAAAAGTAATAGASVAGALAAVPVWGWIALAGLAAVSMLQGGETRNGASYVTGSDGKVSLEKGPSGGEIASTQARAMFDTAKTSIEGLLTGLGSKAVLTGYVAGLESSENGKGFAYAGGKINGVGFGESGGRDGGQFTMGDKSPEQALKDYQLNLTQSILEGLQVATDIPSSVAKLIKDGLAGAEVKDMSQEAVNAILGNVSKLSGEVNTFNAAMTQLPFEKLKNLSFDTAAGLIAAAGGFEKLDANLGGYYANFYSAEEQRAQSITNTSAAFAALGLTMPKLDEGARAAYRRMVELAAGQDLSIEANAKAYTALLAMQGPMSELAPAFDAVAVSVGAVAGEIESTNARLRDQLAILTGTETDRSIALRDAGDESTRSLMRQIYAQQDFAESSKLAAAALEQAAESARAAASAAAASVSEARSSLLSSVTSGAESALSALSASIAAQQASDNAAYEADKAIALAAYTSQQEVMQASIDATTNSLTGLSDSVGRLKGLSSSLRSTLDGMRVAGSDADYRSSAQAQISAALTTARSGGGLPLDGQLASALSTVGKPSQQLFGSFEEYARDFYKTANDISALAELTDAQLTDQQVAESLQREQLSALKDSKTLLKNGFADQVSALDGILENARLQLDAANGMNSGILSVAAALAQFQTAVSGVETVRATQGLETTPGASEATLESAQSRQKQIKDYMISLQQNPNLTESEMAVILASTAMNVGVSEAEIAAAWGANQQDTRAWFALAGVPQFAQGINRVPYDMQAIVHKDEAIVPAAFNPFNPNAQRSDDTASALRAMADRLDRIEANTRATAGHTAGTDRKLARVIPGNALITESA